MDAFARRYTVTLEVEASYADQDEEEERPGGIHQEQTLESKMNHALAALLLTTHRPVLERLMRKWLMETVFPDSQDYEPLFKQAVPEMGDSGGNTNLLEWLLEPVIADLPPAEQKYARQCMADAVLPDNLLGALYGNHSFEVTQVRLEEREA